MQKVSLSALILLAVTVFTVSLVFSQYVTRQFAANCTARLHGKMCHP